MTRYIILFSCLTALGCADPEPNHLLWDCDYPITICQDVITPGFRICVAGPEEDQPDDTD